MSDFPTFTDGRRAALQPIVKCWNLLVSTLPRSFHWLSDDVQTAGVSVDHISDESGEPLGGYSGASVKSGTLVVLLDTADVPVPQPGHVISIQRGAVLEWYRVTQSGAPNTGKNQITVNLGITRLIHPFFSNLLDSQEGDTFRQSYSIAAMGTTELITNVPVNHRTGSTKLYELTPELDTASLPAGVAINATTGVITITKASVVAGVYYLDVTARDTLAPKRVLKGGNHLVLTITA